jgi:hypothetical protein
VAAAQELMSFKHGNNTMASRKLILGQTISLIVLAVAVHSTSTAAPPEEQKRIAFLDRLKVGQAVGLTEKDSRYEVSLLPPDIRPLSHTVIEVGQDFITLRDLGNITDTVVPIYSIKSIRVLRTQGK